MTAYQRAAATIGGEHHALSVVIELLQRLLSDIEKQHTEPDFSLLAAALYYIDDFPERCHHPKEDEYLFKLLRQRTGEFNAVLDELQADHVRTAQLAGYMERALVHYQAGAPGGLARFRDAVNAYAVMLHEHMRAEEALLDRARSIVPDEDWQPIAAAFEANVDPLFGRQTREEFSKLYMRIMNLLPRKMRLHSGPAGQ